MAKFEAGMEAGMINGEMKSILSILSTIIFIPIIVLLMPFCFILAVLVTLFLSFCLICDLFMI